MPLNFCHGPATSPFTGKTIIKASRGCPSDDRATWKRPFCRASSSAVLRLRFLISAKCRILSRSTVNSSNMDARCDPLNVSLFREYHASQPRGAAPLLVRRVLPEPQASFHREPLVSQLRRPPEGGAARWCLDTAPSPLIPVVPAPRGSLIEHASACRPGELRLDLPKLTKLLDSAFQALRLQPYALFRPYRGGMRQDTRHNRQKSLAPVSPVSPFLPKAHWSYCAEQAPRWLYHLQTMSRKQQ